MTAAAWTATPVDTTTHQKLFMSSDEFYQDRVALSAQTSNSFNFQDAVESLEAVATVKATSSSALRPKRRFGKSSLPERQSASSQSRSRSPSPTSIHRAGKIERDERREINRLSTRYEELHTQIFNENFATITADPYPQTALLDEATTFLKGSLKRLKDLDRKGKYRRQKGGSDELKEERRELSTRMRSFYTKIYALYAPLIPTNPIPVDAGAFPFQLIFVIRLSETRQDHLYNADIVYLDEINQVLIILIVVCNMVMGLSTAQCNFLVAIAGILIKMAMATNGSSEGSSTLLPSQNGVISDMPTSLSDALQKFDVDGVFIPYATCPSCNATTKGIPVEDGVYHWPDTCTNSIVGKEGARTCGEPLLICRKDGIPQPIKPYLVGSLPDYIARCLLDPVYLEQSVRGTDAALQDIQRGIDAKQTAVHDVFEAEFIKDFKGPDGKLFVDRGNKVRLAFSIHSDFFNPNGITHRGAHDSIGVISCANLALDSSIRYLPENMFLAGIIPGPSEPKGDQMDHFIRPIIEQFVQAWSPGYKVSRTASSDVPVVVEAGILLSVNDLPAARKVAGFQGIRSGFICSICELRGTDQVFNTDHDHWNLRDVQELRHWANAYKNATNLAEQTKIWEDHGVRWSSLWLLDYWNPTTMLVIDSMHCLLEGLIQYHCRHVLRLDASSTKISSDGLKYAFDWPWIPYDHDLVPNGCPRLSPKHIPRIANIHQTLCLALEGAQALTLDAMWTRLENGAPRDALRFVAHTLSLPTALNDIHEQISSTYVKRARKHFTADKDAHQKIFPFSKPATQKNHFIALLLNWVSDTVQSRSNPVLKMISLVNL